MIATQLVKSELKYHIHYLLVKSIFW